MKLKNIAIAIAMTLSAAGFTGCKEADPEFVHTNNLISEIRIKGTRGADGIPGVINEYNAQGELVPTADVTEHSVAGGHGVVIFELSRESGVNPEGAYLSASLTFDEIIRPGLSDSRWNLTNRDPETGIARGKVFTCTAGTGAVREYTVIAYYEGEYQITPQAQPTE